MSRPIRLTGLVLLLAAAVATASGCANPTAPDSPCGTQSSQTC